MEVKHQLQTKPMEIIEAGLTGEVADVSKYNLRCNRNISGKMTKKDFIYDIRRPLQGTRKINNIVLPATNRTIVRQSLTGDVDYLLNEVKCLQYEEHKQRSPIIVPARIRKSKYADPKIGKYSMIANNESMAGGDNAAILPVPRDLKFECNLCHEPMATLSSLSTHVKFHQRRYCKECYWILEEGETMGRHVEKAHRTRLGSTIIVNALDFRQMAIINNQLDNKNSGHNN